MELDTILPGAIAVLIGFLLATSRDELKAYREQGRRDRAVLRAIREEIDANRGLLTNNQALVKQELKDLAATGARTVNPLDPVQSGFWDLVKRDLPRSIAEAEDSLPAVREAARLTGQVNQMIESRERFKATLAGIHGFTSGHGPGMPGLDELAAYDRLLETFQRELLEAIDRLDPVLEEAGRQRSVAGLRMLSRSN